MYICKPVRSEGCQNQIATDLSTVWFRITTLPYWPDPTVLGQMDFAISHG